MCGEEQSLGECVGESMADCVGKTIEERALRAGMEDQTPQGRVGSVGSAPDFTGALYRHAGCTPQLPGGDDGFGGR